MGVEKHAVVVGAGIGGLGAAAGLSKAGWRVTLLERVPAFGAVGAGISMYPNALAALAALGLEAEVDALPEMNLGTGVRAPDGRWLVKLDGATNTALFGGKTVGFQRGDLHELLRSGLTRVTTRTSTEVFGADEGPDGRWIVRDGAGRGIVEDADVVVAADGIHSRLRMQHWPDLPLPVYTGSTSWRGVAPMQPGQEVTIMQTFGDTVEFGIVPLTNGKAYWFCSAEAPPDVRHADGRAVVRAACGGWHEPVPGLIESAEFILHNDVYALPVVPDSLVDGRVVLIGDAGHGMTPHLGQGGCTALEDAVVLAVELAASPEDIPSALLRFDAQRRTRVAELAATAEGIRVRSHTSDAIEVMQEMSPEQLYGLHIQASRWRPPAALGV